MKSHKESVTYFSPSSVSLSFYFFFSKVPCALCLPQTNLDNTCLKYQFLNYKKESIFDFVSLFVSPTNSASSSDSHSWPSRTGTGFIQQAHNTLMFLQDSSYYIPIPMSGLSQGSRLTFHTGCTAVSYFFHRGAFSLRRVLSPILGKSATHFFLIFLSRNTCAPWVF